MIFEYPFFLDTFDNHTYREEKKIVKENEKNKKDNGEKKSRERILEVSITYNIQKSFLFKKNVGES